MPSDKKRSRSKGSKKKKSKKNSKRRNKNYSTIEEGKTKRGNKESYGEEPWCLACDCKRCLNGRCGVGWLPVLGLGISAGIVALLFFTDSIAMLFETDGTDTLYEEICDDCTYEPTSDPTVTPTYTPTIDPTSAPTVEPTIDPTGTPSVEPTSAPTTTDEPTSAPTAEPTSERRMDSETPSILLIITEDLQESDFSLMKTPNMDNFLQSSYTFTNIQGHPVNYPSRGSLMTGMWAWNLGMNKTLKACDEAHLRLDSPTWAARLHEKGYKNYYFGKWNLGADSWEATPRGRGWDFFYGALNNPDGLERGDGGTWVKTPITCKSNPVKSFEAQTYSHCLAQCYGTAAVVFKAPNCGCHLNTTACTEQSTDSYMYKRVSQRDTVIDWWKDFKPAHPKQGVTGDELIVDEVISRFENIDGNKWTVTLSFSAPNSSMSFAPYDVRGACGKFFKVDYDLGVRCQRMSDYDAGVGRVLAKLKSSGLWDDTVVIFTNVNSGGIAKDILSIGGGAVPAEFLGTTNNDPSSLVDVAPTIMSMTGYSTSDLRSTGVEGISLMGKAHAKKREVGQMKSKTVTRENNRADSSKCGSESSYTSAYGFKYNAPWLNDATKKQ